MKYLLAHDLGTSGNKATLFSETGALIASESYSYPTHYQHDTWAEQNPEDWWQAVIATTRALTASIPKQDIAAVSFSGQMMGCVLVDREGCPLRPAIIWADMRAVEEQQQIGQALSADEFYHLTGHRLSPSYGGQKLMWVKKHEPEVYQRTYKMLNAKDYVILRLTGEFVTEYTDASSTNLLELDSLRWSDPLFAAMGLDKEKMPRLLPSTAVAGTVNRQAARCTGLLEGTPVVCGGGDGVCAAIGTGCIEEGVAHSSMGTSSWISITSKKAIYDAQQRTFTWAHIVPGYVLPTGTMQTGGGALAWYVDEFCKAEQVLATERNQSVYQVLEEELNKTHIGSDGLLFLPYLLGERSPRWNPNARACFVGAKMEHGQRDFVRAIEEGVAMNLNEVLRVFRANGQDIRQMVVVGGGVRSAVWQSILANVYDVKILLPDRVNEAASMGAAITAGVGVGLFEDFKSAYRFFSIEKQVEPDAEAVAAYARLQDIFNNTYQALSPIFDQLKNWKA